MYDVLENLVEKKINCLDKGFVILVDCMPRLVPEKTADYAICQMARVSYGEGTKKISEDRSLIRYLMRHAHSSPYESVNFKFYMKLPIFVARQIVRTRTACLASDVEIYTNAKKIKVADFYKKWQKTYNHTKLSKIKVLMLTETNNTFSYTNINDIWENGEKEVLEVELYNNYKIKMTKNHLCYTEKGWLTLEQAVNPQIRANNVVTWKENHPGFAVIENNKVKFYKIKTIKYTGFEKVYDLEVVGPYHNFVANGFVVHNSINEISARYSILKEEFHYPDKENIKHQSKTNKQGGEDIVEDTVADTFLANLHETCDENYDIYQKFLTEDVSREQARMILPLNIFTEWFWCINLHNLFHFLALRCDSHAQFETRVYAEAMLSLIKPIVPFAVEAWEDYHDHRSAIKLTRLEIEAIQSSLAGKTVKMIECDNKREQAEWVEKAKKIGLIVDNF